MRWSFHKSPEKRSYASENRELTTKEFLRALNAIYAAWLESRTPESIASVASEAFSMYLCDIRDRSLVTKDQTWRYVRKSQIQLLCDKIVPGHI